MTSERASHANRRNAAKSTGPRTPSGKAQSKQNARKHGLSIADLDSEMESQIEHLARQIAGKHSTDDVIMVAARDATKAHFVCEQVQVFKSAVLWRGANEAASEIDVGQNFLGGLTPQILIQLGRIDRYEARALSRRKFAFRRFLELVN